MKVGSQQPAFLPWAGFMNKLLWSDVFVIHAGMQGRRDDDLINRVKLNGAWLTIPIQTLALGRPVRDRKIADIPKPARVVYETLRQTLGSKKFTHRSRIEAVLARLSKVESGSFLIDLTVPLIEDLAAIVNWQGKLIIQNDAPPTAGTTTERLFTGLSITLGRTDFEYGSGRGGKGYLVAKEVPDGAVVMMQAVGNHISGDTCLTTIVKAAHPALALRSAAEWIPYIVNREFVNKGSD